MAAPFNSGTVDWSGENPGIYLRENENAPWLSLSTFFRVVLSPHGRGIGAIVLGSPREAVGEAGNNICIGDNEPLMRYLVKNFVSKFASFRDMPGLAAMTYLPLGKSETFARGKDYYVEVLTGGGTTIELRWEELGDPIAADVQPPQSATGQHQMYSVFQAAQRGSISVNGKKLAGQATLRDFMGRRFNTAFLAYSETWLTHGK
ncbi:MAG: hypothetical protein FJX35_05490 [Alphaproteobacteria bacterium]|nr:hypothetical protein [Alphaproteobacteria bacterium]